MQPVAGTGESCTPCLIRDLGLSLRLFSSKPCLLPVPQPGNAQETREQTRAAASMNWEFQASLPGSIS